MVLIKIVLIGNIVCGFFIVTPEPNPTITNEQKDAQLMGFVGNQCIE